MPEFSQKTYMLNVSEDTTIGLPLLPLTILNRDSNAQLDFSIEQADLASSQLDSTSAGSSVPFGLTRPQANKVYLILDRSLTYKKRRAYSLRVKCVDLLDGLYSNAIVEIRVQPNTNFRPRFERDIYKFDVWENASVGWLVGQIRAIGATNSLDLNMGGTESVVVYKLVSTDLDESQSGDLTRSSLGKKGKENF